MTERTKYQSPSRRETSRTATENAAMAKPGRFQPAPCAYIPAEYDPDSGELKPGTGCAANRAWRRAGGFNATR